MNALSSARHATFFFQLISAFYGSSSLAYAQLYRSSSAAHLGLHTSSSSSFFFLSIFLPDIYIHADHILLCILKMALNSQETSDFYSSWNA
jgi:hypothetical protein